MDNNQIILLLTNQAQVSAQWQFCGLAHSEGRKWHAWVWAQAKRKSKPFTTCFLPWGFGSWTIFWDVKWWQQSRNSCRVWASLSRLQLSKLPEADNHFLLPSCPCALCMSCALPQSLPTYLLMYSAASHNCTYITHERTVRGWGLNVVYFLNQIRPFQNFFNLIFLYILCVHLWGKCSSFGNPNLEQKTVPESSPMCW